MSGSMTPSQHRRLERRERLETVMELAHLAVARQLRQAGATHLERAEVRTMLIELLELDRDRDVELALDEGASLAAAGRALRITRQAAAKRYRP